MSERLDYILKQALTPDQKPDLLLDRKILNQIKEKEEMKIRKRKWVPGIVFSLVLILAAGSGVAYAAYKLLNAEEAAEKAGDEKLARAFSGEDAVEINETQHFEDFDVTLLGIASGENLAEHVTEKDGEILSDRSYIVTAVTRTDGNPMPENLSDAAYDNMRFFISPLIQGCDPMRVNIVSMDGVYTEFVQDGTLYRLTECSNIEIFADRTVYLCVSDADQSSAFGYNEEAYTFDDTTGAISRRENYEGVNALFVLPLDKELADPEAAEEYLSALEPDEESGDDYAAWSREADAFMSEITPENIEQYADRIEESVHVFGSEEDEVWYDYTMPDGERIRRLMSREREFPDGRTGMSDRIAYFDYEIGIESLKIVTFTLNKDGTVTGAVYLPKVSDS